jgi:hypothetical protein
VGGGRANGRRKINITVYFKSKIGRP